MVELSIVIPVYRAEDCIHVLHERLTAVLHQMGVSYEIVLIEDCGPDNSWQVMKALAERDPHVRSFRLSRNFGQHAAITAGLEKCGGQWAIVMDCDLQDPPEVIPALFAKGREGFDVVLARRLEKQHSSFRRAAAKLYFALLNRVIKRQINGDYGSFSLISRKVVDAFLQVRDHNRHYLFILYWLGFRTTDIAYEHAERYSGESTYTIRRLVHHALEGIFFQSTTLLRWIVYSGFACSLGGLLFAVFLIYRHLIQSALPGWTSLSVLILGMGGAILICIGMVGLYIGKVFEQVQGRPLYLIDQEAEGTAQ